MPHLSVLSPQRILAVAMVVLAVALATLITLATGQPHIGVELRVVDQQVVVGDAGPHQTVVPGTVVTGLRKGDQFLPLEPVDLVPEPDMAFTRYSDMDAFFARQQARHALLSQGTASLQLANGGALTLPTDRTRPLGDLPFIFWFQLFCAAGGLLAGASVLAFRWRDPATLYYALTGIGMLMFAGAAAVYSTRELALDGRLFMALSAVNQFGALLFCGGLIGVLLYYPTRLMRVSMGPAVMVLYVGFGLAIPLRLHDSVEALAHLPITLGYFSTYALAAWQWWRTRGDAYARAALRAFLLAWLFGSGAFVAVMVLPAMMGIDNGAIQGYAFGFFLLIYAGIAAGVLRYQLFRLDRWWFTAWGLFFGGLGVIALDLLLVYLLRLDARTSLLASLAIAGWVYFPLRQWLWERVMRRRPENRAPALVGLVTDVLSRREQSVEQAWRDALQGVFSPLHLESAEAVRRDQLQDSGLILHTGDEGGLPSLRLHYAERGRRLFHPDDLALLSELRRLFAEILAYRGLLEAGVQRERERVAQDLHDDVGARLLTLTHRLPEADAEQARRALEELRAVVYSMQAPVTTLDALLGEWRAEVAERCELAGVALRWSVRGELAGPVLDGGSALALSRILREVVTNSLKHCSGLEQIDVDLVAEGDQLNVTVSHTHDGAPPDQWRAGLGLNNLRRRVAALSGEINWQHQSGRLQARWHVRLGDPRATTAWSDTLNPKAGIPIADEMR